jgi:hypothetical protein
MDRMRSRNDMSKEETGRNEVMQLRQDNSGCHGQGGYKQGCSDANEIKELG